MSQFPADCLHNIFEFLEEDKNTLYSCLLVNRLWCEVSVRILWRDVLEFELPKGILCALFAFFSDETKELLRKSEIIIPTLKSPLFNYISFCNAFSITAIDEAIDDFLDTSSGEDLFEDPYDPYKGVDLLKEEILKMLFKHITTLKKLSYYSCYWKENCWKYPVNFTHFLEAKDCLMKLSELRCDSDVLPEIFSQLSKICHNIKSLDIEFKDYPSSELTELISSQNNLEHLSLSTHMDVLDIQIVILIPLTKQFNTITRLTLQNYEPISFIFYS